MTLERRRKQALELVEQLWQWEANMKGTTYDGDQVKGSHDAGPPRGTYLEDESICPPRDHSLYRHYSWKINHAPDVFSVVSTVQRVEWEIVRLEHPQPPTESMNMSEREQWIIDYGEDQQAEMIAWWLNMRPEQIKSIRAENDRDPDYGHRIEAKENLVEKAQKLKEQNPTMSYKEIGFHIGKSEAQAWRYCQQKKRAA